MATFEPCEFESRRLNVAGGEVRRPTLHRVEVWRRTGDEWAHEVANAGESIQLPSIDFELYVDELYEVAVEPTTQAFERYAYVRNRPLNFVDPSGFAPELQCDEERAECQGSGQEVWRGLAIETEPASAPGVWNEIEHRLRAARAFASDPLGDMDLPAPVE